MNSIRKHVLGFWPTFLCLLLATLPARAALVRGPYLQMGTPSSVIVRWRTDSATDSRVRYGASQGSLTIIRDVSGTRTEHEVRLEGLTAGTRYYYSIGSTSQVLAGGDSSHYFQTSPTPGTQGSYRIWVLGDSGTADSNQAAVRDAYARFNSTRHTNLWLMLGDNAYSDGTDSEFQDAVFDMYPEWLRQSVLWPALGNHDGHSASSSSLSGPYYEIFTLPRSGEAGGVASGTEAYYSFDYGNIHFICLNSEDVSRSSTGTMANWLRQDLVANTRDWTIAYWHHPPYSKGSHDSDSSSQLIDMRENFLPILEGEGVDLVLSGHSHSYERSFLLDGHYGDSSALTSSMKVDAGNGRLDGNGAYEKPTAGPAPHEGAVYVVAGSSGKTSGGSLDHPAMVLSLNELGSLVIDVEGSRLDAKFLDDNGSVRDYFTIVKNASAPAVCGNRVVETGEQCDDGNAASGDCCSSSCRFEAQGSTCSDGQYCTVNEACNGSGSCAGGTARNCADTNVCTDDSCNEGADRCDHALDPTNDPSCVTAVCGNRVVETGEQCDDGNAASGDCCSSSCRFEAQGSTCSDGQYCTVNEACNGSGSCAGGTARNCADAISCTTDRCDEAADACAHAPSDGLCDDGLYCNGAETCSASAGCRPGAAIDCSDLDPCTDDRCDDATNDCDNVFDSTNDPSCGSACPDADRDGHAECTLSSCDPGGLRCGDCDDGDATVHPTAAESCGNGKDDDCDGAIDSQDSECEGCLDADSDGYSPEGGSCGPIDCADADPTINPGAREICGDLADNDCDGFVDGADSDCSADAALEVIQIQTPRFVTVRGGEIEVRRVRVSAANVGNDPEAVHVVLSAEPATGITIAPQGDPQTLSPGETGTFYFNVTFTSEVLATESTVAVKFVAVAVDGAGRRSNPVPASRETVVRQRAQTGLWSLFAH